MFEYSNQILKNEKNAWKKYHDALLSALKNERVTDLSSAIINLGGQAAMKYSYLKRDKFNFTQYVIKSQMGETTITFAAPLDSLPKYSSVYQSILNSFEIVD